MTSANSDNKTPTVYLDLVHKGLKVKLTNPTRNMDVLRLKNAAVAGLAITIPMIVLLALWTESYVYIAATYFLGLASGAIGIAVAWLAGKVRRTLAL